MATQKNPWKKIASKVVYENNWIRVREDSVVRPDGSPGIYGVVEARKAVGIIALTPQDEVYLVGQYRYPTDCYSWEIIEGGSEIGESPIETAKRELREEAGLVAQSWKQLGGEIHLSNCFSSEVGVFFLAQELTEVQATPDPTEVLEIRKLPLNTCKQMIVDGDITDALTIIGLQRLSL